jgi:hypothetical protein
VTAEALEIARLLRNAGCSAQLQHGVADSAAMSIVREAGRGRAHRDVR